MLPSECPFSSLKDHSLVPQLNALRVVAVWPCPLEKVVLGGGIACLT